MQIRDSTTTPSSAFSSELDTVVKKALDIFHIPGASIAIIQGTHVHTKAYGFAELSSAPATTDTLYHIGSITKSFLALTTTKYIASESNQKSPQNITLRTPIKEIVGDDFVLPDELATTRITIEDTLSHRTGSSRHDNAYGGPINTPQAVTRNLRYLPMNTDLRTTFEYCNSMYITATHALETAAGRSFDALLKAHITGPLHMNDTHTSPSSALKHGHGSTRLYRGYGWNGDWSATGGKHTEHVYGSAEGLIGAAGCIISNVHDMAKYVQALLGHGNVLTDAVRDEVMKPRILMAKNAFDDGYAHYALGFWRYHYQGIEIIQHTGDVTGYSSLLAFIPSRNWGIVFLGNGDWASCAAARILHHLVDEMLGTPMSARFDPTTQFLEYIRAFTRKDPDIARKYFPNAPNPGLPTALALEHYTGKFFNKGYRDVTIHLVQPSSSSINTRENNGARTPYLEGNLLDRSNVVILQLFHVSGEYWVGYKLRGAVEVTGQGIMEVVAESRIGVDGRVDAWGISMEDALLRDDWRDRLIWFESVVD